LFDAADARCCHTRNWNGRDRFRCSGSTASSPAGENEPMGIEENKAIVLRFFDRLAAKDIDAVLGLLSESFTFWVAGKPQSFALAGSTNKDQYAQMLRNFFPVFPKGFRL